MINTLKAIQIILFSILIIPSVYVILREPFMKNKTYRKTRLTSMSFIFLISTLIFIILSIIITANDDLYSKMNYAPFMQSWIIIKSTFTVYVELMFLIFILLGFYNWCILVSDHRAKSEKMTVDNFIRPKKLKLIYKFKYPYLYYETFLNPIKLSDNEYVFTKYAHDEMIEFNKNRKLP